MIGLQLAIKNIFRKKRRTLLNMTAYILGFVCLTMIGGAFNQIFTMLKYQAIANERLGHLIIEPSASAASIQERISAEQLEEIEYFIEVNFDTVVVSPRIHFRGIVSGTEKTSLYLADAMRPEDDEIIKRSVPENLINDIGFQSFISDSNYDALIAEGLASDLDIAVGDDITLLGVTGGGWNNAMDAKIKTVINTGNPATNDKWIMTSLESAQLLLESDDVDRVSVIFSEEKHIAKHQQSIQQWIDKSGYALSVKTWYDASLFYSKVTNMFGVVYRVVIAIVASVLLLMILNSMMMSVSERRKELATLQVMGMSASRITKMLVFEGLGVLFIALAAALPLIWIVALVIEVLNIQFTPPIASMPIPLNLLITPSHIIVVSTTLALSSVIASAVASHRVVSTELREALLGS